MFDVFMENIMRARLTRTIRSADANKAATSRGADVRGSTESNTVTNRPFPLSPELGESHGNKGPGFCHRGEYTTPVR